MTEQWNFAIRQFISLANKHNVKMLMVGGGAVNFHGYQRHSADVDFWIETTAENFKKLILVFQEMDYEIDDFPEKVKKELQNISVKFSPIDISLELITNFSITRTFREAYDVAEEVVIENKDLILRWRVLSLEDLIDSKIKSGRPKDLVDIQELKKINKS